MRKQIGWKCFVIVLLGITLIPDIAAASSPTSGATLNPIITSGSMGPVRTTSGTAPVHIITSGSLNPISACQQAVNAAQAQYNSDLAALQSGEANPPAGGAGAQAMTAYAEMMNTLSATVAADSAALQAAQAACTSTPPSPPTTNNLISNSKNNASTAVSQATTGMSLTSGIQSTTMIQSPTGIVSGTASVLNDQGNPLTPVVVQNMTTPVTGALPSSAACCECCGKSKGTATYNGSMMCIKTTQTAIGPVQISQLYNGGCESVNCSAPNASHCSARCEPGNFSNSHSCFVKAKEGNLCVNSAYPQIALSDIAGNSSVLQGLVNTFTLNITSSTGNPGYVTPSTSMGCDCSNLVGC